MSSAIYQQTETHMVPLSGQVFFFLFLLDTFLMQTKEKEMKDQVESNLQTFARQPRSHTKVPLLKLP